MLTELEYKPWDKLPYKVSVIYKGTRHTIGEFLDEQPAITSAIEKSKRPDIPYTKRFDLGQEIKRGAG